MYCVFCGAQNPEYASFCEKCGKQVKVGQAGVANPQLSTETEASQVPSEIDSRGAFPSKYVSAGEQHEQSDPEFEASVCEFQKTYSEMKDEDILRLAGDMASLTVPARQALESELKKRGLEGTSIEEYIKNEDQHIETTTDVPSPKKYRWLWIPLWFIAILSYNIWSHWSENADKTILYILGAAIGQGTTPIELLLSFGVVYGILSSGQVKSLGGEVKKSRRRFFSNPVFLTICIHAGIAVIFVIAVLVVGSIQRATTKTPDNQAAQSKPTDEQSTVNPNALGGYEIMSKSKADLGSEADGIAPEAKKRMREMFALEFAGAMQKQNNPIYVEVKGDNHDVLSLELPSMNDEISNDLIKMLREGDANFWNGIRLMNYNQVVFSGDSYKRIVTRGEYLGYCKDYEKYKAAFLKTMKGLQAGAQGELKKP
jgi:hypothetical protein